MTPKSATVVPSPDAARHDEPLSAQSLPLFRAFVEEIVRRGLEARRDSAPDGNVPVIDWKALWESGLDASSLEEAIGRVALAADVAARADVRVVSPLSEPLAGPAIAEAPDAPVVAVTTVVEPAIDAVIDGEPGLDLALPADTAQPAARHPLGRRRDRNGSGISSGVLSDTVTQADLAQPRATDAAQEEAAEPVEAIVEAASLHVVSHPDTDTDVEVEPHSEGAPGTTRHPRRRPRHRSVAARSEAQVDGVAHPVAAPRAVAMPATVAPIRLIPTPEPVVVADPEPPPGARRHAIRQLRTASRRTRVAYVTFGWVRNVGAIVLLFAAWQVWGTSIAQHHAQETLREQFKSEIASHPTAPANAPVALLSSTAHVASPAEGSVVAELRIPAIGVDQLVVEGTAEGDLSKGPGHYIGSAAPGQAGNVAIAGHRTTYGAPFYNLSSLAVGDSIFLTTASDERLTYIVSQAPVVVAPNDVAILNPTADNRLTLTTCNPRYSSTSRLVVVAELHQNFVSTATPSPSSLASHTNAPPRTRIATGFVGWRWSYLPAVLVMLAALAGLGLAYRRVTGHFGALGGWLILVPLWAAGLYLLFGLLSDLLPAAI